MHKVRAVCTAFWIGLLGAELVDRVGINNNRDEKKMRLLLNACVLGMCLLSTSCTAILWNKGLPGPVVRNDRKEVVIVKDEIASFAQLKTADAANKFLIVGKEYTYIMETGNDKVAQLLESELDPSYWRIAGTQESHRSINIYFEDNAKKAQQMAFSTKFSMYYSKNNLSKREQEILSKLDCCDKEKIKGTDFSGFKINMTGNMVNAKHKAINESQRALSSSYYIVGKTKNDTKDYNVGLIAARTTLTPFTLVGDVVLFPFMMIFGR